MKQTLALGAAMGLLIMTACQPKPATQSTCAAAKDSVKCVSVKDLSNPDSALAELKAGNLRYVQGKSKAFETLTAERKASAEKQHPFAIVVCCSDSRVPVEEVFDQGVGELFVIRTAGEVIDKAVMGSIEYAAEHLGVKLLVILGHERCGAVTACVEGGEAPGSINYLVEEIKPAVEAAKGKEGDLLDNAIRENTNLIITKAETTSPIIKELVEKGELKIVGAYYDSDEGTVAF